MESKQIEELAKEAYPIKCADEGDCIHEWCTIKSLQQKAFIAGYQSAMPKWISVKDRAPENRQQVLFYRSNISEGYFLGVYKHGVFFHDLRMYTGVTHWMPLPTPHKLKNKER